MTSADPDSRIKEGGEIKEITEINGPPETSLVPETKVEQEYDLSAEAGDFEFRPLTEEEKKEFVNSLNADGKRILQELAGVRVADVHLTRTK